MAGGYVTIGSSPLPVGAGVVNVGPFTITITTPIGDVLPFNFAGAGTQQVVIPAGSTVAVILPPPGNVVALSLLGASTDAGVALAPGSPSLVNLGAGATMWLKAAGAIAGAVQVLFL